MKMIESVAVALALFFGSIVSASELIKESDSAEISVKDITDKVSIPINDHLLPDKQIPATEQEVTNISISNFEDETGVIDWNVLVGQLPENFIVNETSGSYPFNREDLLFMTPRRSILYRLLSKIYVNFDMFDFDGFRDFLRTTRSVMKHQNLRYHMIENLIGRARKCENLGTLEGLAQFIGIIDGSTDRITTGTLEKRYFDDFKKRNGLTVLNKIVGMRVGIYVYNEERRLDPLREPFESQDYKKAKSMIEWSDGKIHLSKTDFELLLEQPSSSARYMFITWAVKSGHLNVQECFNEECMTPLMIAAIPNWSDKIVRALTASAPQMTRQVETEEHETV